MPKKVAKNNGGSGRINLSSDQLRRLGVDIGDEIEIDIAESRTVARALIDSKDTSRFLIVSEADVDEAE